MSTKGGKILVTGASGFLGRHLVDALKAEDEDRFIRALVRRKSLHLERADVECTEGDVCDSEACEAALEGVSEVYHLAGLVSRRSSDGSAMYRVHVDGTRALLNAAAKCGVHRVVVVSTSGTIGVSRDPKHVTTEEDAIPYDIVGRWPYYLSKIYQERTAFELAQKLGVDVVVVNPSLLLGPDDTRVSSTGDVEMVVRGRMPMVPKGGDISFVDARDAARGCILAMQRGNKGERYLMGAANMSLEHFLGRVARLAHVASPRALLPTKLARGMGALLAGLYERFDAHPPVDVQALEMAECGWSIDSSKAKTQLGWIPRDPHETLRDTVRDVQQRCGLS